MEFRLLGPLEVLEQGEPVSVGSRRQRALLTVLLLDAGRVVSSDHILEALWGDEALGKENAMWVAISRLRADLASGFGRDGAELVATRDHGYVLNVDPKVLDAVRFADALESARTQVLNQPQDAIDELETALGLWRGDALEEFRDEPFARAEVARLEELRLEAYEVRADAYLRLGAARSQITDLERLCDEHPLRERLVDLLMRTLYQSGSHAEALRRYDRYRRTLADQLGIDPSPELRRLEEQILLHDPAVQRLRRTSQPPTEQTNPFKGLRAFTEDDAEDFFGRDRLVSDVIRRLGSQRLVTLVGSSGSGKSSAVRAGVLPAVRKGAIEGSEQWLIAQMVPGAHPVAELEAALLRSSLDTPARLDDVLTHSATGLLRAALRLLPEGARLLLFVDQFEELFTLVEDEAERVEFLDLVTSALEDPHGRILAVITLRADFYDLPLRYAEFAAILGDSIVNVAPLTADELESAAGQPLRRAGVSIEPALLATLLADVLGEPGALPLFQYTLTMLFERRVDDAVTLAQYDDMGGLRGALATRAEDLFAELDEPEQAAARQLFLRLVTISGDRDWTRRRVAGAEIASMQVDLVALQTTIERFGAQRLLSFDRDQVTGGPTVEVAHEALLTEWPRLRAWIDEARDDVVRHSALVAAMGEWEAADRHPSYLLAGQRLVDYEQWADRTTLDLSDRESEFIRRSVALRDDADREEAERQEREQKLGRAARRRAWGLVIILLLLLGVGLAWYFAFRGDALPTLALVQIEDEGNFALQASSGWEQAQRDHDFDAVRLVPRSDPVQETVDLVESGAELVVLFSESAFIADELAPRFPETRFVVFDVQTRTLPNLTTVNIDSSGGSFLAGVAAAETTETGVVGYIGSAPFITDGFRAGFEAGVAWVDPEIEVLSANLIAGQTYDSFFSRPDLGAALAEGMYRDDADVVFHASGYTGDWLADVADGLSAELGRHLWVIGVDTDQWLTSSEGGRDHVLTSVLKRHDLGVRLVVDRYLDDRLPPGLLDLGVRDGLLDISDSGGHLDARVQEVLRGVSTELGDGRLQSPSIPSFPPTEEPIPDATLQILLGEDSCTHELSKPLVDGDLLRIRVAGLGRTGGSAALFPGDPSDSIAPAITGLRIAAGGSNSTLLRVFSGAPLHVACFAEAPISIAEPMSVDGPSSFDVARRPTVDAGATVDVSATQCSLGGQVRLPAGRVPTFELRNRADQEMAVQWYATLSPEVDPDLQLEYFAADPARTEEATFVNFYSVPAGESVTAAPAIVDPGTYLVTCSPIPEGLLVDAESVLVAGVVTVE